MTVADGWLYVNNKQGDAYVFAASPKYELLATNSLGEPINASIAVSNGELFIRSEKHLWSISEKSDATRHCQGGGSAWTALPGLTVQR